MFDDGQRGVFEGRSRSINLSKTIDFIEVEGETGLT